MNNVKGLFELERNDLDGALAYAAERMDRGLYSPEDGQVLYMLQDDGTEFVRRYNALVAERKKKGLPVPVDEPDEPDDDEP